MNEIKYPEKEMEKHKSCQYKIEKCRKKAAMRDFDARKFDFITKLSNNVQLEY